MKSKSKVVKLSNIHGIPDCPDIVRGAAREEWDRIVPRLFSMGRLSKLYRAALAAYCVSYREVVEVGQEISQCTGERELRLFAFSAPNRPPIPGQTSHPRFVGLG